MGKCKTMYMRKEYMKNETLTCNRAQIVAPRPRTSTTDESALLNLRFCRRSYQTTVCVFQFRNLDFLRPPTSVNDGYALLKLQFCLTPPPLCIWVPRSPRSSLSLLVSPNLLIPMFNPCVTQKKHCITFFGPPNSYLWVLTIVTINVLQNISTVHHMETIQP